MFRTSEPSEVERFAVPTIDTTPAIAMKKYKHIEKNTIFTVIVPDEVFVLFDVPMQK